MTLGDGLSYLHRLPCMQLDRGEGRHAAEDPDDEVLIVPPPTGHIAGHRRPKNTCDYPDELVYWSDPAERWMRVEGDYPDVPI